MSLITSRAILLRAYPYSDSSRILRFLTRERGLVSLVGKGVRSRSSKGQGALETFAEGVITFHHRADRDLHALRDFEPTSGALALGRELSRFVGASLLGELLLTHTLEEGDPPLYDWISTALERIGSVPTREVPGWILAAAWRTLAHLGFAPGLVRCVSCGSVPATGDDQLHRFDPVAGGLRCPACARGTELPRVGPRSRRALLALVRGEPPLPLSGIRGHFRCLELFCLHHLSPAGGFHSFRMLRPLLDAEERSG
jgi:DNA repair protein RecO (recombination protein O)